MIIGLYTTYHLAKGEDELIQPAGFWVRFGAILIDSVLFIVIGFFLSLFFSESTSSNLNSVFSEAYNLLLPIFWYGYTVGKRALGIRIIRTNGTNVGFWTMVRRNILGGLAYMLPLLIAFLITFLLMGFQEAKWYMSDETYLLESEDGTWLVDEQSNKMIETEKADVVSTALLIGWIGTIGLILTSGLMVVFRKDKRSLHDWIAGTYVTRARPGETSPTEVLDEAI